MLKILINNAFSSIEFSDKELRNEVSEILSYFVEGSKFANNPFWDGRKRFLDKKNRFPTGLLPQLTIGLKELGHEYTIIDERKTPERQTEAYKLREEIVFRPYQTDAIAVTETKNRGVFLMGTGAGKSLTSAGMVNIHGVQTLVITPDTGLREQLAETYEFAFGKKYVSRDVTSDAPIVVANIQSLMNKDKECFLRFKMLLIDEFHHAGADSYRTINSYCQNAFWRFGFTGTFTRSGGDLMELMSVISEVLFKKTTSELIEEGWLVRPKIQIFSYEVAAKGMDYKRAYEHVTSDVGVNQMIADIANLKISEDKQTLVLVRYKGHGRLLHELVPGSIFLSGDDKVSYREQTKKDFIDKKVRCLIATSIFGEGTDIPSIDVLINGRFEKTEIQTKQGVGRALRLAKGKTKAEIFDFLIKGNKHLYNHSAERIKSYHGESAFKICVQNWKGNM